MPWPGMEWYYRYKGARVRAERELARRMLVGNRERPRHVPEDPDRSRALVSAWSADGTVLEADKDGLWLSLDGVLRDRDWYVANAPAVALRTARMLNMRIGTVHPWAVRGMPGTAFNDPSWGAPAIDESAVPRLWCVAANIRPTSRGQDHTLSVFPHFRAGSKVYVLPPQWGDGGERLVVVGRTHTPEPRFIRIILAHANLYRYRAQAVLAPAAIRSLTIPEPTMWQGEKRVHAHYHPEQWRDEDDARRWASQFNPDGTLDPEEPVKPR